jgi:hypothetical protein
MATGPGAVKAAMVLIGIGCSPVLMAAYCSLRGSIRRRSSARWRGSSSGWGLGNIAASLPLALAVEALGWRGGVDLAGVTRWWRGR